MAAPTESSRLWTTGGAGDGASTFTRDQLAEMFRAMLCGDPTTQGVLSGLAVSGTSSPMTLAIGSACVYGFLYFCTVAGDVTKSTPAVGTTGFRVVLRASWAAQTVRVTVISNTDGVAAIPAVTQTASTTWDITLATGTITTGGVITLTDARDFCTSGPYAAALSVIGRSANTVGVTNEIVAANDGEVLRRSGTSIGFGTVATAGLADDAVTTAKIADSQVTAAKIANRTRTFLVQALATAGTMATSGVDMPDSVATDAVGRFYLPSDYVSGMTITPIVISLTGSGDIVLSNSVSYAADGESVTANSNSVGSTVVAISGTSQYKLCTGLTSTVTAAAAGDFFRLSSSRTGTSGSDTYANDVFFVGWLVSYTADS